MRWRDTRWFLLFLFPVGYLTCQRNLGRLDASFFFLTILDAAACALLLARLNLPFARTMWAWISLFLMLDGYFARMYFFVSRMNHPAYINRNYPELRWVTRQRIIAAYPWASLGFVVFCVGAVAALSIPVASASPKAQRKRRPNLDQWAHLVVAVFLLYILTSLLQIKLGYGIRGVANPSLPFRAGTFISLFREEVVPSILVLAVWVFDGTDRHWSNITLFFLLVAGIIDSLLSTSRGELLLFTVPVFALWGLTKRITRGRKWALATILVIATILVPLVTSYRERRLTNTRQTTAPTSLATIAQGAFFLGDRAGAGGIEAVWYSLDHKGTFSVSRTLSFLRPYSFTRYYTGSIVSVHNANDYRSSGMFGAFVIIGGAPAVVLLTVLVIVTLWGLFALLRRLRIWPVAFSLGAVTVTLVIADPTGAVLTIPKLFVPVLLCEWVYVRLTRPVQMPTIPRDASVPGPSPVAGADRLPGR